LTRDADAVHVREYDNVGLTAQVIRGAAVKAVAQIVLRAFAATHIAHVARTNKCSAIISCFGQAIAARAGRVIKFSADEQAALLQRRRVARVVTNETRARVVDALGAVIKRGVIWREI